MLARTGDAAARRGPTGVRDQVGRCARDRLRRGRAAAAREPQPQRHHRALPRAAGGRPRAGAREAVLDGEVVAFESGRPLFQYLQGRMHLTSEHAVRRSRSPTPSPTSSSTCSTSTVSRSWSCPTRNAANSRARAERAHLAHPGLPPRHGRACSRPRRPGPRGRRRQAARLPVCARAGAGRAWLKVKNTRRTEAVIGGWLPGRGPPGASARSSWATTRTASSATRELGTGFIEAELDSIDGLLDDPARTTARSAAPSSRGRALRRAEPRGRGRVLRVDQAKTLRQPSYKGLRDDIEPEEVGPPEPV